MSRTYYAGGKPVKAFAFALPPGTYDGPPATCWACRHCRSLRLPGGRFYSCDKSRRIHDAFMGFIDPNAPACGHFQRQRRRV